MQKTLRFFFVILLCSVIPVVLYMKVLSGHMSGIHLDVKPSVIKPTLTVVLAGRLGNMMFIIASAVGVAERNSRNFQLLCSKQKRRQIESLRSLFPRLQSINCALNPDNFTYVKMPEYRNFNPRALKLEPQGDVVLHGFMQSYKYFLNYSSRVKQLFEFSSEIQSLARELLPKASERVTVGIHVRRGDYLEDPALEPLLPKPQYFELAMNFFRSRVKNPLFIVVSEDLDWCRDNIKGKDVEVKSTGSAGGDLCLLSMTDHVILSYGTYSWWSGFLNRGTVVYYQPWPNAKDGRVVNRYPPEWLGIPRYNQSLP